MEPSTAIDCTRGTDCTNSNFKMGQRETSALWRELTPVQRAMLRRLDREGPLVSLGPWEMRTVRSLLSRGLVRPRSPVRDGRDHAGLWFLTSQGTRILPRRAASGTAASEVRTEP